MGAHKNVYEWEYVKLSTLPVCECMRTSWKMFSQNFVWFLRLWHLSVMGLDMKMFIYVYHKLKEQFRNVLKGTVYNWIRLCIQRKKKT